MPVLDENDCCFERDGRRFRYRVGAIIVEDGRVLLARNDMGDYYYSVGGGVHLGETAEDAVRREVREETGVDYEIERLAVVHENFFDNDSGLLRGLVCHELALFYLMKSRGRRDCDAYNFTEVGKEYMEWLPIDRLSEHKVFPSFLGEYLAEMPEEIKHIVERDY